MNSHNEIASLLIDLEAVMRNCGLWSEQPPSPESLASTQPFCVDTLDLHEWLQFIFIPRMSALVDAKAPMPEKCEIYPVAEQVFANPESELMEVIAKLDAAITAA